MKIVKSALLPEGAKLGVNLTVLGVIDGGAKEPVYIVWHQGLWCPLACKVFPSQESAEREAAVLSEFAHPFIVRNFGIERPGCLLMPFLEGRTLADIIDHAPRRRLAISDALRVALHVGSALIHIHDQGYLHLDIKPGNIIVTPGGRPILFDFGTARQQRSKRPSAITGTNSYIAPEECALGDTGPAADVFSLGVTLYEMMTGEMPFGQDRKAIPFPQLTRVPDPLANHRKGVPEHLENLIFACLERNPDFRPTLSEILPALNGFITAGPAMWPDSFDPSSGTKKRTRSQALKSAARAPRKSAPVERPHGLRLVHQASIAT